MSRMSAKAIRYAVTGVVAAGMLAGCAGSSHLARAGDHAARSAGKQGRAVGAAERTVAQSPNDAAARIALGQAYLDAGRFESAATTFEDAVQLGDSAGSTQLRLALAHIGAGNTREAVAVLNEARDSIEPADRGLALALAGETGRGVAILVDALRGGENSPKLRQNLAYAYALDGRWREARIAMSQDVPADKMDDRISEWAMMSRPEDVQKRVASLLSVPAGVADAGQPEALALGGAAHDEQLATAQPAVPVARTADAELPAIDQAPAPVAPPALAAESTPAPAPVSSGFAAAFTAPLSQSQYVSTPVVQEASASPARVAAFTAKANAPRPIATRPSATRTAVRSVAPAPSAPKVAAARSAAWPAPVAASGGTHVVQLGSFSIEANAHRAVGLFTSRNPELRGYRMTITPVVVNGRNFWRVAAAGLNGGSASRLCSGLKSRGNACFAYAINRAPAGAVQPALAMGGGAKARSR